MNLFAPSSIAYKSGVMTSHNKTREELIAELQLLQDKYNTLKELYAKEQGEGTDEQPSAFKEKKWLDYIFESTRTGIDIIDEDYNLLFVDKGWQNVYGSPCEKKCYEYFMGQGEPCPNCALPEAFRTKKIIISEEFLINEKRFVEVHTIPFQSDNGQWLVGEFNVDIDERKKIENELIKAKEKAEEGDRLKTAFLQNLSHEIRTPLNTIVGFSEILNNANIDEGKRRLYTNIVVQSSSQLLSIVSDILTISSIDTNQEIINNEQVCIDALLSDLQLTFSRQLEPEKDVRLKSIPFAHDNILLTLTDKGKLTQILSTLLSNAVKFTHTGEITFGYTVRGNQLEFFVSDTGIGIDNNKLDLIFKRFVQADETIQVNYGGTGLGLSICKGLVDLLGGKIHVESEPGKGSTFYFTIPYVNPNEGTSTLEQAPTGTQPKNEDVITLLIAEDQEPNYLYLKELLSTFNYNIIIVKNGEEAVENCANNEQINLVLMDIKMPVMDGYTAAKKIKEIRPNLPIIAQTAYATKEDHAKYHHAFDDYLTKPFTVDQMIGLINKHLTKK